MKKQQTPVGYVISGIIDVVASVILFNLASSEKGSLGYYFDEDTQGYVAFLQLLGYIFVISAIVSFVMAIVRAAKNNNVRNIICPHCSSSISEHHLICPHCNNYVNKSRSSANQVPSNNETNIDYQNVETHIITHTDNAPTIECVFCGKLIPHDHIHCDYCGRRQD